MSEFHFMFEILGVLGLIMAIFAEVDIFRHRMDHARRRKCRRSTDRCGFLDDGPKKS